VISTKKFLFVLIGAIATTALAAADDQDWPLLGRNADVQHNSPLRLINDGNVAKLGLAWVAEMTTKEGMVGNAIVVDGVVYQGAPRTQVFANDLKTGKLLWKFEAPVKLPDGLSAPRWGFNVNRGVAVSGDHVFYASADCQLYAINRKSGQADWSVEACDSSQASGWYTMTMAPRVGNGMVFVGNACGDTGIGRGHVDAFDEKSGKQLWRFYTVPDDPAKGKQKTPELERAVKTWGKDVLSKTTNGCGSVWDGITYDAKLNQLYIGVDGPAPWNPTLRGADAGDELYTNSVVALDASTGKYLWHFKETPHDAWNYSGTAHLMLADLPIGGSKRRVVMTAPKNGFFYVLDAKTGKFISANNVIPLSWASGVDPKTGRPIPNPESHYWEKKDGKAVALPSPTGAHSWQAMAYNEQTGLVYLGAAVMATMAETKPDVLGGVLLHDYFGYAPENAKYKPYGELVAWDPVQQKARWRVRRELPYSGGTLTTAGNLVFQGTGDGNFEAFAADTGKRLWSFDTGGVAQAAPSTVTLDGEQMILMPVGNGGASGIGNIITRGWSTLRTRASPARLLAFKLGGTETLAKAPALVIPKPPLPRPDDEKLVRQGEFLWEAKTCAYCHGHEVGSANGNVKDLRFATAETHQLFAGIVIGGLRKDKGMPVFPEITMEEANALQAYVLDRAWAGYLDAGKTNH
jgi:quinohemoprotein ethanol dehydrogenase